MLGVEPQPPNPIDEHSYILPVEDIDQYFHHFDKLLLRLQQKCICLLADGWRRQGIM